MPLHRNHHWARLGVAFLHTIGIGIGIGLGIVAGQWKHTIKALAFGFAIGCKLCTLWVCSLLSYRVVLLFCPECGYIRPWRIYIVKFWTCPPRVQILSISCSNREILAKSYVGDPPLESWRPHLGEILDPPLLEVGSLFTCSFIL